MPFQNQAAYLQLCLLLLALPAQYLISEYVSRPESERSSAVRKIVVGMTSLQQYFYPSKWRSMLLQLLKSAKRKPAKKEELPEKLIGKEGESPAVEVLEYRNKDGKGYFALSTTPRSPRPFNVKFRVGQVVKHKTWGYRGVIIGWDETAKAPEWWLNQNHPADKQHWRNEPNYSILVDTRDRAAPQTTYVPGDNLEVIKYQKIFHPSLEEYFENYDGSQYLPRPWLRTIYPHD